jgi:alpha,alpha-trehalase
MTRQGARHQFSASDFDAFLFDLDGVVTRTSKVHAAAWKELFDDYLRRRAVRLDETFRPFDPCADYNRYLDGKTRYEGVESFLASRSIELPMGDPQDGPEAETVCGLGNRKNEIYLELLRRHGVETIPSALVFIQNLRLLGIRTAVVSASRNGRSILARADLRQLFDAVVDGNDVEGLHLPGMPDPAIFLEAVRRLGTSPSRTAVVDDALAGIQAARKGGFGFVIGVDRSGQTRALELGGADMVVSDLAQVRLVASPKGGGHLTSHLPSALDRFEEISAAARGKRLAVFLDYDGTLAPIVASPELAALSDEMRKALEDLARRCTVAVVSGRDLRDVQRMVGLESLFYAGSHGFEIQGPEGRRIDYEQDPAFLPLVDEAERLLRERLAGVPGALVERKRFSVAAHYRNVAEGNLPVVIRAVEEVLCALPGLRRSDGKMVYDLQPRVDWNKGKALLWMLEQLGLNGLDVLPVYVGDDLTDEDAFRAIEGLGLGVVVRDLKDERHTAARYALADTAEVLAFLKALAGLHP